MPQFLNEGNPGWGNALSSIGSSLANWGMNQMQIKQEREQKAQDLEREERLWKEHADTALRLGVPQERVQQVRDAQTGKAMEQRQRLKFGSAVEGTASEWENVGDPTEAPPPKKQFQPSIGAFTTEEGGYEAIPSAQDFILKDKTAGAARTSITLPPGAKQRSAFQEAKGAGDYATFKQWREDASTAADTLQTVDTIKQIMEKQKTGGAQAALAYLGQPFGTDAAANMQALKKITTPMILAQAKALKPVSNDERKFLEEGAPNMWDDPRSNALILDTLEKAANKSIKNYEAAQAWIDDGHEDLSGFKPIYTPERVDVGKTMGAKGAGASQENPVVIGPGSPKPPAGTWVKLPNGQVKQVQ